MAIISIPTSVGGVALPGQLGKAASGPLSLLYQGKGVEKFHYPMDLAKDPSKSHYVEFFIKEIIPAGFKTTGNNVAGKNFNPLNGTLGANTAGNNIVNNLNQKLQNFLGNVGGEIAGEAAKILGSTANFISSTLTEGVQITPQTTQAKSYISLYMPDTLTADYSQSYQTISLKDAMGPLLNSIRSVDQIAGKAIDAASGGGFDIGTAKKVWSSVSSDPAAIAAITSKIGQYTSQEFGDTLLQAKGYAFNPQLQMIYSGTDFRSFQLSFTFTPNSKEEAQMVNNIIYAFKYFSAPSLANVKESSIQNMFLIPPALFNVKFKINGVENTYLPKYADCVLDDIAVNYAPNGFAAHVDGAPIQTQLTLSFTEIEIVERSRLSKGYSNPSDEQGLR
jgi:hypothetical protein